MRIAVIGTGHVGLVTAACLTRLGHDVVGMDDDDRKINALTRGERIFFEPALDDVVTLAQQEGRLSFTTDLQTALRGSAAAFICVGTPSGLDGGLDLSAVEEVARRVAGVQPADLLLVEKSTVTAQTGASIEAALRVYGGGNGNRVEVASNPEFLREGSAVHDFMRPDRIVVGVRSAWAEERLRAVYAPIISGTVDCPADHGCVRPAAVPFVVTNVETAELIKHASNAFLATKISFINAIADVCDRVGADVRMVAEGMGLDPRVGSSFLRAGLGYGGSCFPKDVAAFTRFAETAGADFRLLAEVTRINQQRVEIAVERLRRTLWILRGKRIGLLGLAFKPDTDDIRESPALAIARRLLQEGSSVVGFDPHAAKAAQAALTQLQIADDPRVLASEADALILATEWPQCLNLDWGALKRVMRRPVILDGRNALDKQMLLAEGFEYLGMGG